MPIGDEQWVNEQLAQLAAQRPAAMPTGTPDDGTRPSWTGLLGTVLGGGQNPGYKLRGGEADTSGNRALLNFGIQTLLASGPAPVRPDLLSAVASGLQGAQSSTDLDQRRAQASAVAQQGFADKQQEMRLAALKEALPLLKLQQEQRALAGLKGGATSTAAGPAGDPGFTGDKAKDLALIAKRESGGDPTALNYVAKEDPTAYERGATASGKYQIVNSTWAEGMRLAGLDPSKYVTARSAPEAVQDQVASALYDKYGSKPWVKGARDWVKGADGKYQLAAVAPSAPAAPGGPPAAPGAAPAPPGVQVGGVPPPPPGGPRGLLRLGLVAWRRRYRPPARPRLSYVKHRSAVLTARSGRWCGRCRRRRLLPPPTHKFPPTSARFWEASRTHAPQRRHPRCQLLQGQALDPRHSPSHQQRRGGAPATARPATGAVALRQVWALRQLLPKRP